MCWTPTGTAATAFAAAPTPAPPLPLPAGVACYTVAATLAARRSPLAERLVGDGLVPLRSALGQHDDPARCLAFAKPHQYLTFGTGHLDLLNNAGVAQKIVHWLQGVQASATNAP
jgi:hypothetical protein